MQKTIKREAEFEGVGIHSGKAVKLRFSGAPENTGIVFRRVDLSPEKIISVKDFQFTGHERRTAISKDGAEIHTVEHLMAAAFALSLDNLIVDINGPEMPGADGSARPYYDRLKDAGLIDQGAEKNAIKITEPLWCEKNGAFLGVFPYDGFRVSYILESQSPVIKRQALTVEAVGEILNREIISARTFCLREEAEMLLKMGFGKGASIKNTLVLGPDGPIDNELRFPDEPVRHKILDLVGDLYLTGGHLSGSVIAIRSGHELNAELVKKIRDIGNAKS